MSVAKFFRNVTYSAVGILLVGACASFGEQTVLESSHTSPSMYSIFVIVNVKPEHREAFIEASELAAQGTVRAEPGVFQFHMLVDETNPNRFYFFEIFRDEQNLEAHWETENFKTWWGTVEEMLDGEPERVSTMRTVFPSSGGLEKQKPGLENW